jgi:hypothetical protein
MLLGNFFKEHKDVISSIATLIGVLTALLYVIGFIAERIHWNYLGYVEAPTDFIEFLYRGGIVIISGLAAFPLYILSSINSYNVNNVLLTASIVTIIIAISFHKIPKKILKVERLKYSHLILYIGFVLLLIILIDLVSDWPLMPKNYLFQEDLSKGTYTEANIFQEHVGISVMWLIFFLACRKVQNNTEFNTNVERNLTRYLLWQSRCLQIIKRISFLITIMLLTILPFSYGSYQYSNIYPIVQVILINKSPETLKTKLNEGNFFALLYETDDAYVLYSRFPQKSVFKVKKSAVTAVIVHRSANILNDSTYRHK